MSRLAIFISRVATLAGVLVALGAGFILGQVAGVPRPATHELELMRALPPSSYECVPATALEKAVFELALTTVQRVGELSEAGSRANGFDLGATRFLSHGLFRQVGDDASFVCPPADLYARLAEALDGHRLILRGRLTEVELRLFAKFPAVPNLVDRVGQSAFNADVQESMSPPRRDVRPFARSVLALYGDAAQAYRDRAFEQMSSADSMGTGAAQVAVATHHAEALERTETLMRDLLASVPDGKAVPWETKYRLYELAHALALGGPDGKAHTAPLRELMDRLVQSWAGHFGMVELPPKQACHVLAEIEGEAALMPYAYCLDDTVSDA